ncbi:MAG TPA: heat-inducible transcriptional repressor HrcA [Bacillota bacterium]|nr:heat-inducible transcriptional repressor HrcA [Bacillota bacterium]
MDPRKQKVLQAIIDDYIRTAEPVGSRTLARAHGLGVSPATIRNEMADLEQMGYLEQPHTSAGRVPSDKGYRYYVDSLLASATDAEVSREAVRRVLAIKARMIEDVTRQAARLLAEMTDCLALASQAGAQPVRIRAVRVVPLDPQRALLIVVGEDGSLRSKTVQLGPDLPADELERIAAALSGRLEGATFGGSSLGRLRGLQGELGQFRQLVDQVLAWLGEQQQAPPERLWVDGARNLLNQPEFHDVPKAQAVLAALEHEQLVDQLLGVPGTVEGGAVAVAIGRELHVQEMEDCSLVTALYVAPGSVVGRIGVLGPKRMNYRTVMKVVELVASSMTTVLAGEDALQEPGSQSKEPGSESKEDPADGGA